MTLKDFLHLQPKIFINPNEIPASINIKTKTITPYPTLFPKLLDELGNPVNQELVIMTKLDYLNLCMKLNLALKGESNLTLN